MLENVYWSSSKAPFVLIRPNETLFYVQFFEKYSDIEIHEYPSNGSRVVPCGRTDGHDEANSRFSQFRERASK